MAVKALIFLVDDMFNELKTFYAREVNRGNLEIVAVAVLENGNVRFVAPDGKQITGSPQFELAIISSHLSFYQRLKWLEAHGIPRARIIDGRVFKVPNLDFPRFIKEGVAYGILNKDFFVANSHIDCPQVFKFKNSSSRLILNRKSYINKNAALKGDGLISVGKISSFAEDIIFALGQNLSHNYRNVGTMPWASVDWEFPEELLPPQGTCKILIGNDVWAGRGCIFKCTNPQKPLVIGDGAVIASDSVVVKNVPPYAIVGGNPAQIIKYRFPQEIIDALLRIKWWDWSLDKIHDNFKYFNDIEKFIALHDTRGD